MYVTVGCPVVFTGTRREQPSSSSIRTVPCRPSRGLGPEWACPHERAVRAIRAAPLPEAGPAQPHSFCSLGAEQFGECLCSAGWFTHQLPAAWLQVLTKNSLKGFMAVVGPLRVIHFLILSKTRSSVYFKLMQLLESLLLTFKVHGGC